jgi:hypothetical protein
MKQLKEECAIGYFRSIALSNNFIHNRMKEIRNGRPLCGCGGCHECYYVYLFQKINDTFTREDAKDTAS